MSRLPANLVQAPKFDSPLRRTEPSPASEEAAIEVEPDVAMDAEPEVEAKSKLAVIEAPIAKPVKSAPAKVAKPKAKAAAAMPAKVASEAVVEELVHAMTLRLTQEQFEAVQTECFHRRMARDKTNPAALVREILDEWIAKRAGDRSK
jgi:hypothetical protein